MEFKTDLGYKLIIDNEHMEKGLSTGKHYESSMLNFIGEHFKKGNFIDVGAHVGNHSLAFSGFTKGWVYSFEGYYPNYKTLLKNIDINNIKNIIPFFMNLGNSYELCSMKIVGRFNGRNSINAKVVAGKTTFVSKLDLFNLDCSLIKIDVEGYELNVLRGAIKTIKRNRPVIFVEFIKNTKEITDLMKSLGYKSRNDFNQGTKVRMYVP